MQVRLEGPRPGENCALRDRLFALGVEFPCGGEGTCGACRVRAADGEIPITGAMRDQLTAEELAAGWRLGCQAESAGPVTVEVDQWSVEILDDRSAVRVLEARQGFGVVIDVGTTTVVAQFVDLHSGEVLRVETALNAQAQYGSDVMSRIAVDRSEPGLLTRIIRGQTEEMIGRVCAGWEEPREVLLAGNTVMHHLWAGLSVEPLAAAPFRPEHLSEIEIGGMAFLECAGGFVGSDLLCGLIALGMAERDGAAALLDLGTNGEIAVGGREGIQVASTAAGPAFEAGRIRQGMRAGLGAIDRVDWRDGRFDCRVIGGGGAKGLCGSGLVDAVAAGLDAGRVEAGGRIDGGQLPLVDGVGLIQRDVRELQLAKGAVAAGLDLLADSVERPSTVGLAGAFGNYVRAESARRIGLLPEWVTHPVAEGNTALKGLRKLLLMGPGRRAEAMGRLRQVVQHVELASLPGFEDVYVERMRFAPPVGGV